MSFILSLLLFSMFAASCIAVYKYKWVPKVLKAVTWYLLVELIGQSTIFLMLWWYPKENKYFILHIAFVLEAITLFWMYREIFKKYVEKKEKYAYRKIFAILIVLFTVFAIVNSIYWQPLTIYPTNTRVVLSVMLIIFNILYIYKHNISEPIPRTGEELVNYQMSKISLFWITTGLLLFHSFALLVYANNLRGKLPESTYKTILFEYNILAITLFVFIAIGIFKAKRIIIVNDDKEANTKK